MSNKTNYSYIGISLVILVFGIIFIPRIVERISNKDVIRNDSRSQKITPTKDIAPKTGKENSTTKSGLAFIEINGEKRKVPAFDFTNQDGKTITNSDYLGKVYVVEFFFTTCPTICPIMNKNLVQIQNQFKEFQNFGVASFTISPEIDTPEVLKAYANKYGITNPNWHLMTGKEGDIYKLANEGFYIYAAKNEAVVGGFEHSGNFALIDKNGFLRSRVDDFGNPKIYYRGTISEAEKMNDEGEEEEISILKEDIAKLLKE